jgi:hypothetical protein
VDQPPYRRGGTSIRNWSSKAGAGVIGNMRKGIRCSKGSKRKHERQRKACGSIRHPSRRGSTGKRGGGNPTTVQTASITARLRHGIEWGLVARQKRKQQGIEWRGIVHDSHCLMEAGTLHHASSGITKAWKTQFHRR